MNKEFELILERLEDFKHWEDDSGRPIHTFSEVQRISKCKEIVKKVIEEYNNGWIPVSHCFPNQDGEFTDVLITCENMVDGVFVQSAEFYLASDGSPVFDALYYYDKVLAWKPLPEPYKE